MNLIYFEKKRKRFEKKKLKKEGIFMLLNIRNIRNLRKIT